MGGPCSRPDYLLSAAEAAMSPRAAAERAARLVGPKPWVENEDGTFDRVMSANPFPEGRKNELRGFLRIWEEHARRLVWC